MSKKIIAILGATGAQGGGLAKAILNDKNSEYAVRAITRDINSDASKALVAMGAEVVAADINDKASLVNAFKGAYGAFCVTFFWSHFNPELETSQAKMIADATKEAGVQHVIWSSLEDTRDLVPLNDDRMPTLMGNYKCPHFDCKGEADSYFLNLGVPVTVLYTSFYWDNFIYFGLGPKKGPDGNYYITLPMGDKKLPGIAADDIGKCAYGIFKKGSEYFGKKVGIAGEHLTGNQMAEKMTNALGINIGYYEVTPEAYRAFGFPGAEDLGNMFQYKRDFETEFCGARNIDQTKSLNSELQSLDMWLDNNKSKIPLD